MIKYFVPVVALLALVGCGRDPVGSSAEVVRSYSAALETELTTYVTECLQVDELDGGPSDANLVLGNDADGSPSVDWPVCSSGTFVDWSDLDISNHVLYDLDDEGGVDHSSFPQKNECVNSSHVLSKMDLNYIAVANNTEYAYFAVQRSGNNGDAGYYWLFTHEAPTLELGAGPCSADQGQLVYYINPGDVLFSGHFKPSADVPLLTAFVANQSATLVAGDAIDYESSVWTENPGAVKAVAVNLTPTDPGTLGMAGVKNTKGDLVDVELFAEAAVDLELFTGGSTCGATFYGSVITRPSGSGGTSPDLKDLAGPAVFNFGEMSATASVAPTCGLDVEFSLDSATGLGGSEITNPECLWEFDDGTTLTDCSGSFAAEAGLVSGTLTVSDPSNDCSTTVAAGTVEARPPLVITADLTPTCEGLFYHSCTVDSGGPVTSLSWSFEGGEVSPSETTDESGYVTVGAGGVPYSGTVTVTDQRGDLTCTASATDTTTPYVPLSVSLDLAAQGDGCNDDTATYTLNVSGGSGDSAVTWNGVSCDGLSCTVDPADSLMCGEVTLSATVTDADLMCEPATTETETYTKQTTITASDN